MGTQPDDVDERQARIDQMIAEFRDARQRLLVKRRIAPKTETSLGLAVRVKPLPEKLN